MGGPFSQKQVRFNRRVKPGRVVGGGVGGGGGRVGGLRVRSELV